VAAKGGPPVLFYPGQARPSRRRRRGVPPEGPHDPCARYRLHRPRLRLDEGRPAVRGTRRLS